MDKQRSREYLGEKLPENRRVNFEPTPGFYSHAVVKMLKCSFKARLLPTYDACVSDSKYGNASDPHGDHRDGTRALELG